MQADYQCLHYTKVKRAPKAIERTKVWTLANESDQHAEELEANLHLENNILITLDKKIDKWKKEVEALQQKIQAAETKKNNLQRFSQIQLEEDTKKNIQYLETVVALDLELSSYNSTVSQIERRICSSKVQYEQLKPYFPF